MFATRYPIFTLLGFRIFLDLSWFVLAALITWTLATGYFPAVLPALDRATYYLMGVAGAAGLFASILLHELAHAVVARRYNLRILGITLFIFGGVAELADEPETPKAEFQIAIAGPVASLLIAGACALAALLLGAIGWWQLRTVLGYLAFANAVLALFNLIPAFPLDGGRILRAALWGWQGDLAKATRIAALLGSGLGIAMMAWGVYTIAAEGTFLSGLWQLLIGYFVLNAARASRTQSEISGALRGIRVAQVMQPAPITVPAGITAQTLVDDYFYKHHHKFFPVVENGDVIGSVRLAQIAGLQRDDWGSTTVATLMEPLDRSAILTPQSHALDALEAMHARGVSRFLVMDGARLAGLVTMRDILNFIAIRMELNQPDAGRAQSAAYRTDSSLR